MPLNQNLLNTLRPICDATIKGEAVFANAKSPLIKALASSSMIETDGTTDPTNADKLAYSATLTGLGEFGMTMPGPGDVTADAGTAEASADAGVIEGTQPAPERATPATPRTPRGERPAPTIMRATVRIPVSLAMVASGRKTEQYPFASLEAPDEHGMADSFFVGCDTHLTNPVNQLAGTIGSANKRYKDEGKVFKIIRIYEDTEMKDANGKGLAGARVLRIK